MIIIRSYFCKGQFAPFLPLAGLNNGCQGQFNVYLPLAGQKPYCKGQNPA